MVHHTTRANTIPDLASISSMNGKLNSLSLKGEKILCETETSRQMYLIMEGGRKRANFLKNNSFLKKANPWEMSAVKLWLTASPQNIIVALLE